MTTKELIKAAEHLNRQAKVTAERVRDLATFMSKVDEAIASYSVNNPKKENNK